MPELLRRGDAVELVEATLIRLGRHALAVAGLVSFVGAALGPPLLPVLLGAGFHSAAGALGLALAAVPLAAAGAVLAQTAVLRLRLRARAMANGAAAVAALGLCGVLAGSLGADAPALGLLGSAVTTVVVGRVALQSPASNKLVASALAVSAAVLAVALLGRS